MHISSYLCSSEINWSADKGSILWTETAKEKVSEGHYLAFQSIVFQTLFLKLKFYM